ncbi:MAG TPA: hypothetical protein VHW74_01950 [Mycobacteriales bacterium]|jgi:hypothetical protein|nr:hypothetical protein [Mycobacteriales bacterium]
MANLPTSALADGSIGTFVDAHRAHRPFGFDIVLDLDEPETATIPLPRRSGVAS